MKILITGVTGQLGYDVAVEALSRAHEVIGISRRAYTINNTRYKNFICSITDEAKIKEVFTAVKPDVVIHCAAWTAVDAAEESENKDILYKTNVEATKYISKCCEVIDAKLIYISTDYVFDGQGTAIWQEAEQNLHPINLYGESKLLGEQAILSALKKYFIVRISWVFGINGNNFVKTMLSVGQKYDSLKVVNDQIGLPTYTKDLAGLLLDMAESTSYGIYHATNTGSYISWYDFAKEIFKQANYQTNVIPVTTDEYGISKANRPKNSRLSLNRLSDNGFTLLPNWKDALQRYLQELRNEDEINKN
ncbi:dTDP-4-dehydrorhamnose reductase [Veillonella criceti]|uniref:dTDP-4-dehydrorhamnose reductase n=1 Tax=Veillonella criceti TaxID=103891 RepID=A0A380NMU6_9FIRM|nr:dTDP-4-dehydrorhamnose reductase [Veillonella criceti]SUP44772.1 dTDP-4-dehydrorhamnose reductase [Veillonella criceti]